MFHLDRSTVLGTAGEHLVCADLIQRGYWAFLTAASLPYDIVTDIDGTLLRVQVRTAIEPRPRRIGSRPVYMFNLDGRDKSDLFALVGLDIKQIAYIPAANCPASINLDGPVPAPPVKRKGKHTGCRRFSDFPLLGWHHNAQHTADRDGKSVHVGRE